MPQPRHLIGIDIGATSIKAGLLRIAEDRAETKVSIIQRDSLELQDKDKTEPGILDAVETVVQRLCHKEEIPQDAIHGIGAGVPGILDVQSGLLVRAPNLPLLRNVPLAQRLSERLQRPTAVDNDVNVIALGEAWQGAGRGRKNMIFFALGTGCGGGLLLDGRLWRGEDGMATEFGHINVQPDGPPCGCGSHGCLEQYASQTGLIRMVKEDKYQAVLSRIEKDSEIPLVLSKLARQGDRESQTYFDTMGRALGIALAGLSNSLNIHCVLFGGGLSRSFDLFQPAMRKSLGEYAYQAVAEKVETSVAELWEDAGLYGAAALLLPEFSG